MLNYIWATAQQFWLDKIITEKIIILGTDIMSMDFIPTVDEIRGRSPVQMTLQQKLIENN